MKRIFAALALAAAFGAQADGGQFKTGNQLYEAMTGSNEAIRLHALGYVIGVHDLASAVDGVVCTPMGVVQRQVLDVVQRHLAATPEERHANAAPLVVLALAETWPCTDVPAKGMKF